VNRHRVTGPWHPPGTTPLEELTLVKRQLEKGRPSLPTEAIVSCVLLIVLCVWDVVRGSGPISSLAGNGALILGTCAISWWLVRRYRRLQFEWLQGVEAFNRFKKR
jgi:hypothetical protein